VLLKSKASDRGRTRPNLRLGAIAVAVLNFFSEVEFGTERKKPLRTGGEGMTYVGTTIPHSSFGDIDCWGCLTGVIEGDQAQIECSECGIAVRRVPTVELNHVLHEMELSLPLSTARCPHCGSINLFSGLSQILSFLCKECRRGVQVDWEQTGS
jgi:endogenous inhibitor of DNA gyrase (YacG/DUF329 family)